MKLSTLVLSGLILAGSSAAFAEGGSERVQQFYENFRVSQQQVHGDKTENTAQADKQKPVSPYSASDAKQKQPDA
ncbi:hypothetical protein GV819_07180 [Pseudomonas sp. Fl5BN2]|uniref:hypothetical protein n=1 Tax=unclassified Pseudomonas TaxID=196821 RepID=UPI001377EB31|nr:MULTISPECIES: hypothetical protein [unclassified Pseudomonas]NBF02073.1 hypothetical protein [Pseudomonas sp. Fl5BN2]NBF07989.1 hypothetical protein [Pseudomonas sp. Fl4BN1]